MPAVTLEQPVYYGVEVERRVEVTRFIEVEVSVPIDVPVYIEKEEKEVARVGGGWARLDGQNQVDQSLHRGATWRQPPSRKPPVQIARVKLQQQRSRSKFSRPPPSPLYRELVTMPKSQLKSRWDAPKFMSAADLDLLKAAVSRAEQRVVQSERDLATANRKQEHAHRQMETLTMREYARERPDNRTALAELREQRALDHEWRQCERQLHLASNLVTQRQASLDHAQSALHEAQYAVAIAREEIAESSRHRQSLEGLKQRHAAELASLLERAPPKSNWRKPRGHSGIQAGI